ncbi:UNVERIFIED_CONTAM: hypothetical protein Sangu_0534500 [Sesamum angustifolium]|uniref:Uncharacterized protein n=1 Tax=Sesamum angustifolium TaxID=2727405 RepID=A0AAW2Q9B4_9LAMI
MATAWGAFWGTRVLEIVKKHNSGGLVWKRIKLTSTRKANAKKRLRRVWQFSVMGFDLVWSLGDEHTVFFCIGMWRLCCTLAVR